MRVPHCGQVTFGVKDSMLSNEPLADIGTPRVLLAIRMKPRG
jgi:hypothetical protein